MKMRTFGKISMVTVMACATMQISGCGGGGGGGVEAPVTPKLSADQTAFESMYLSPSSSFSPAWSLTLTGAPVNGTNYFYAHPTTILASPLTSGAQTPFSSANISVASTLSIPVSGSVNRYMLNGQIVTDAATTERFSYQGSSVKDEILAAGGATLYTNVRSGITSTPLSGLVVGSQADFAHWFNALFSNPSLLTGTATWGAGSAYLEYTATNVADRYRVFDFSTTTTGTSPSPVATGTTIAALMAGGGIASTSDATTYTMANGSVSVISGVTTYVASVLRPKSTSNLYRTYYEVGGNVVTGDLLKAGDVVGGSAYDETVNGATVTNYSAKYQIRINQAAINSLKAAVTF
jgi:hypothetical protein